VNGFKSHAKAAGTIIKPIQQALHNGDLNELKAVISSVEMDGNTDSLGDLDSVVRPVYNEGMDKLASWEGLLTTMRRILGPFTKGDMKISEAVYRHEGSGSYGDEPGIE